MQRQSENTTDTKALLRATAPATVCDKHANGLKRCISDLVGIQDQNLSANSRGGATITPFQFVGPAPIRFAGRVFACAGSHKSTSCDHSHKQKQAADPSARKHTTASAADDCPPNINTMLPRSAEGDRSLHSMEYKQKLNKVPCLYEDRHTYAMLCTWEAFPPAEDNCRIQW